MLPFIPRSNISRLTLFTVMALALLAAWGIDTIRIRLGKAAIVASLVVGVLALDLFTLAYPLTAQTFVVQPLPPPAAAQSPLQYTSADFITRIQGRDYHRAYAATQAGYGVFTFCSVIGPTPNVATTEISGPPIPVATLLPPTGTVELLAWSPQSITLKTATTVASHVILNMNYAPGWRVGNESVGQQQGRLAVPVEAGEHIIELTYHPPLLPFGLTLTILTILIAIVFLLRPTRSLLDL